MFTSTDNSGGIKRYYTLPRSGYAAYIAQVLELLGISPELLDRRQHATYRPVVYDIMARKGRAILETDLRLHYVSLEKPAQK